MQRTLFIRITLAILMNRERVEPLNETNLRRFSSTANQVPDIL